MLEAWFDMAFVLNHTNCIYVVLSLLDSLISSTVQSRGPLLGVVIVSLTIIATTPSSENLTPTGQLPVFRLYALPLTYGIVLPGHETFPTLTVHLFLDAVTHTPEVAFVHVPITSESLTVFVYPEPTRHHRNSCSFPAYRRVIISALQCSLYATASKIARPSNQSTLYGAARTFTSELSIIWSPIMIVGYDYTAEWETNRDRTFTG